MTPALCFRLAAASGSRARAPIRGIRPGRLHTDVATIGLRDRMSFAHPARNLLIVFTKKISRSMRIRMARIL